MYSRGANAIAEQLKITKEEAQEIINNFYNSFPMVKNWMDNSLKFLKEHGYVEDFYGRRRRLTDIWLPPYEVKLANTNSTSEFNPIIGCKNREIIDPRIKKWKTILQQEIDKAVTYKLSKDPSAKIKQEINNKTFDKLAEEASKEGVLLIANTARIAQAERQCVNARIQGSSATMTKAAMVKLLNDEKMKQYGFKLCIGVHDELIGEVREEYAQEGAERLCEIMRTCVSDKLNVPFKCDPAITTKWYEDEVAAQLKEAYEKLLTDMTEANAKQQLLIDNPMFTLNEIEYFISLNC